MDDVTNALREGGCVGDVRLRLRWLRRLWGASDGEIFQDLCSTTSCGTPTSEYYERDGGESKPMQNLPPTERFLK